MSDGFIIKRGGSGASGGGVDPSVIARTAANITADMLKGVTKIGDYAFYNYSSLTSITIPDGVTSIGVNAFMYSYLTSVTIPNSVTTISEGAFKYCSRLSNVTIPNGVTRISNDAFYHCSSLASVTIPNSVTSIGNYVFDGCSSLVSIEIPDSVTLIYGGAFFNCTSLTSVTVKAINPPLIEIDYDGYDPFNGCNQLGAFYVPAESVDTYKSNRLWSRHADKIQAIPSD